MQTETGTPVQYMAWSQSMERWYIRPAVIHKVEKSVVDILILGTEGNYIQDNIRHEDFKEVGKPYWRHLPMKDGGQYINEVKP